MAKHPTRYVERLNLALRGLQALRFRDQTRPSVPLNARPTRELVDWAARLYCFSILSHYREILRTYLQLIQRGRIPAAIVLVRCLFEFGAHSYYVKKHLSQFVVGGDLQAAWKFLEEATMGSRWLREELQKEPVSPDDPYPLPRHIAKVINCYSEFAGKPVATYSSLSEYAHPTGVLLGQYWRPQRLLDGTVSWRFAEPERSEEKGRLPIASISLLTLLPCVFDILSSAGENEVRSRIRTILESQVTVQNDVP